MADILIRMEMPKNCAECPCISQWDDCEINHEWKFADEFDKTKDRLPSCPLVPLPEGHGRLGDLDALSKEFERLAFLDWDQKAAPYSWAYAYSEAQAAVDDSPTIVPAEGGGEDGWTPEEEEE